MATRRERLSEARLYLVCDEQPDAFLEAAIRGGVDVVQLRMKDTPDARVVAVAERFARVCGALGALFILNDRPDLAARIDADGVHVGQDDMTVADARGCVDRDRLVGLSTHSPEQVERAAACGVDYIGVGPVYATPTKPGRAAVGLELVRYAAAHATVPWFAIGGVDPDSVRAVAGAGARRVAVVRALSEAPDPATVAHELRVAVTDAGARVRVGAA
jgi:thiamine-phosphate pyrophosphorylase